MRLSEQDLKDLLARRAPKEARKLKYGNKKKVMDGITFDSTKEANRYTDLKNWQLSGQITKLRHQVPFPIRINGELVTTYNADFTYTDPEGNFVVEDTKSKATRKDPVYALKKKLIKAVYGIEILET